VRRRIRCVAVVLCLQTVLCLSSRADGFTNIINGISTNVSGYYIVGEADSFNYLEINSGGVLTSHGGLLSDQISSSNNSALVTGSNSLWNCLGYVAVGENGSSNLLTITNGGHLNSFSGAIGDGSTANNNVVLIDGSNSVWNCGNRQSNPLIVGNGGSGNQLLILDGAQIISNTSVALSYGLLSSNNVLIVAGANSLLVNSGSFLMGAGPANQLVVSNGAGFICTGATVSSNYGTSNGNVVITSSNNVVVITGSNTVWNNNGSLAFGLFGGSDQLTISSGAVVSNTGATVGDNGGSNNTAIVDGAGTLWNCRGDLSWGDGTSGNVLIVTNSARINTTGLFIGGAFGADGNLVIVTGSNTLWNNSGSLLFQLSAGNQFQVLNGAQVVSNTSVIVGSFAGTSNTLIVADPNSQLMNSGTFSLGDGFRSGPGNQLVVSNGAKFTCGWAKVGSNTLISVTGSNTIWSNSGSLQFSAYGVNNQLAISDGAAVINGDAYIGNSSSASNNHVLVTGTGAIWNAGCVALPASSGNSLIISNGAIMNSACLNIWGTLSNVVVVTGSNTICSTGSLNVQYSSFGQPNFPVLLINNGGELQGGASASIESYGNPNAVVVTDPGSRWVGIDKLTVGWNGEAAISSSPTTPWYRAPKPSSGFSGPVPQTQLPS
jgi:T5SS/PEP-CTERM-associated repeat protein